MGEGGWPHVRAPRGALVDACPRVFVAGDLEPVLDAVAEHAAAALACERAGIYLAGGDGVLGLAHLRGDAPASDDGVATASWIQASGSPVLVPETAGDPRLTGPWSHAAGAVSVLGHPLPVAGRSVGVLVAARTAGAGFADGSSEVADAVARQGALAIENARRFAGERAEVRRLEELDRLRSDYVTAVTHDLQAPLTGLLGFVATLRRVGEELTPEERGEYLESMERQIQRAAGLVDDMLLGARLQEGDLRPDEPELVDLSTLASDAPSLFGPEMRRRIRVEIGGPILVLADRLQLERVLQNLVGNALKYTTHPSPVVVELARDGDRALLSVHDEGPGIPDSERAGLFERFGRAGPRRRGSTGLGLTIVRGIVEAHGGAVTVDSAPDRGTTFTVTLPLADV